MRFLSKKFKSGQRYSAEARLHQKRRADALYRKFRLLEDRVSALEEKASTLRRDVNRVDRKGYRDQSSLSELAEQRIQELFEGGKK